jgi:His-Xaa-Ser system radical SAM maturase HxsB
MEKHYLENQDFIFNFYRISKLSPTSFLISTDSGSFLTLTNKEHKEIKKGKLSKQLFKKCEEQGIILTEKNLSKTIQKQRIRYQFLENGTSLHIIIPTSRCDQACTYCFASPDKVNADKSKTDMTKETALKTIEYIMNSPCSAITLEFTGGEALLRFDLLQIMIEHAEQLNKQLQKDLDITIVTNLTLMNKTILEYCIEHNVNICTSLDGPKEVHDTNRIILAKNNKHIGTFDTVIRWIKTINQEYKKRNIPKQVNALMTTTKHSFPKYKEIIDLYVELGINLIDLRGMMFVGKAIEQDNTGNLYTHEEYLEFYKKSLEYIQQLKQEGKKISDRMEELYGIKVLEQKPTYHTDYESPWGAATGVLTYTQNGNIYSCHEAIGRDEFKLGNIYTTPWLELFKKKETAFSILSSMLEANPLCDRCAFKPYCGTLPIENFYAQNKVNFRPEKTLKHYETQFHVKRILKKIK